MPPEDAADVFQAVWTDLFSELPRLRSAGALRSWLITVAGHKCYQWKRQYALRGRASETHVESVDPKISFIDWRQEVEREQMLRDALVDLPPRCQEMVRMLFFEQPPRPYKEVAERLGLAEGSIGFIRGRCLTKLRATLEKMGF
jgi:RNA polymerase sigma factor (sigma-70 family)